MAALPSLDISTMDHVHNCKCPVIKISEEYVAMCGAMCIENAFKLIHSRYVDEVVQEANRLQKREKILLTFEEYRCTNTNEAFVIVFFSLCEEKAPISFQDCMGRRMTLPFERCRTWEVGELLPIILPIEHAAS